MFVDTYGAYWKMDLFFSIKVRLSVGKVCNLQVKPKILMRWLRLNFQEAVFGSVKTEQAEPSYGIVSGRGNFGLFFGICPRRQIILVNPFP